MVSILGQRVAAPTAYSPDILEPIARAQGRGQLDAFDWGGVHGADVWHLYELSWLNADGTPQHYAGVLTIPADSPATVESKSLKLYLNSLNFHRFGYSQAAISQIEEDIGTVAGAEVSLTLLAPTDLASITHEPRGYLLDNLEAVAVDVTEQRRELLLRGEQGTEAEIVSHRLRSLCPVTGQPDWGTLQVAWRGPELDPRSLLAYIESYREHQEFHEQCVERIFTDLVAVLEPEYLRVVAFYQRRGGIDITPWRSTTPFTAPADRMGRQ